MKLHNIEFLRFIFAITIVYYHILHSNIMKFVGVNGDYVVLQRMCNNAGWIVECFFIISGYFLYIAVNDDSEDIKKFVIKKFLRLGPVLWTSIIIGIIFFNQSMIVGLFNALFLQCIGLSLDYKGINWYISPFFWAIVFYYVILKIFNKEKTNVFLCGLIYFCYLVNISYCNGGFGRATVYGVINLGLARALAGIGLGYMIHVVMESLNHYFINEPIKKLLGSVLELACVAFLTLYFLLGLSYKNNFVVVIVFAVLFVCFINKVGVLSNILDRPIFSLLGKYSYSIYVMQQTCFYVLQKTIWKTYIVNNTIFCLSVSLGFCILMGVIVYYVVEKPFYNKGLSVLRKHNYIGLKA